MQLKNSMTFAAEEAGQVLSQSARGHVLVSRERRDRCWRSTIAANKRSKVLNRWDPILDAVPLASKSAATSKEEKAVVEAAGRLNRQARWKMD